MPRPYLLGHIITLLTSFLFFYGGQAHLTDRYTPDLSRAIGRQAEGAARAWWFFDLDAENVRHLTTRGPMLLITSVNMMSGTMVDPDNVDPTVLWNLRFGHRGITHHPPNNPKSTPPSGRIHMPRTVLIMVQWLSGRSAARHPRCSVCWAIDYIACRLMMDLYI